jgi:hypothetical protein
VGLAFAGTALVFACFSVAALSARRRSYLFLGAALSSVLSTFMLMRLATMLVGGGRALFEAELYLGLLVFVVRSVCGSVGVRVCVGGGLWDPAGPRRGAVPGPRPLNPPINPTPQNLAAQGYVLYDTQLLVEKAEAGQLDEVRGALSLFVDFAAIFVRLLIILARSADQKQQRRGQAQGRESEGDRRRRRDAHGFRG